MLTVCLLSIPAFSQTRPRFFDNFDTAAGVQVYRPVSYAPAKAPSRTVRTPKPGNASAAQPLVKRTTISRMSVTEGLAEREMSLAAGRNTNYERVAMGVSAGMRGFTTGDATIDAYIVDSSRRYGIDPLLIYSQMHQESSFKLRATSYKGASGLMQLMPATAKRLGVTNIYDPKQNIEGGVKYMRMLLDMFGQDVRLALAGYNAGEGAVMKYGNQIPPYNETQEYVRRISARYESISDGTFQRNVRRVNNSTAIRMEQKVSRPLAVYEPNAVAIRLADGRMRLVNQ